MAGRKRELTLNLRVSVTERDMLHRLAAANDESGAQLVRRFIRQRYAAEFGDIAPSEAAKVAGGGARSR